jgi:hypothetical protein
MAVTQPELKPKPRGLWLAVAVLVALLALTSWDVLRNADRSSPAALRRAAFDGDEATVRRLIAAHPEWIDSVGSTNGQAPMVVGLYDKAMKSFGKSRSPGSRADRESKFREMEGVGATPLWHALARTNIGTACLLIEVGANVHASLTTKFPIVCSAALVGDTNLLTSLEKRGARLDAPEPLTRMTPLQYAVIGRSLPMLSFLAGRGLPLNETNRWGYTALHYAANFSHLPMVEFLATSGADWTLRTKVGLTAFDMAWKNATNGSGHAESLAVATWLEAFAATNKPPTKPVL